MSVTGNFQGGLQVPKHITLANTTTTALYTPGDRFRIVAAWGFVNTTGSSVTCTAYRYDGSTEYPVWTKSVDANSAEIVCDLPLKLEADDEFRVKGDSGVTATVIVMGSHINESARG